MQKIKKGDTVIVIAGKDKGRTGKVKQLMLDSSSAIVEGVQMVKKHVRPNPEKNEQGGVIPQEAKINISNIAIYNPTTKKADRVGFNADKRRVFKSNNQEIDV
jgi:large subunit ribosomal protein L24